MLRAREVRNDPSLVRDILLPVVKSKGREDYYNRTRAAIQLAEQSLDNGRTLNDTEQAYLVGAYQFIFNEGLPVCSIDVMTRFGEISLKRERPPVCLHFLDIALSIGDCVDRKNQRENTLDSYLRR